MIRADVALSALRNKSISDACFADKNFNNQAAGYMVYTTALCPTNLTYPQPEFVTKVRLNGALACVRNWPLKYALVLQEQTGINSELK